MTGVAVPHEHHIARYCRPKWVGEDGKILAVAFYLQEGHEYVSVNSLETLKLASRQSELKEIRRRLTKAKLRLKTGGRFAVANVGRICSSALETYTRAIRILSEPIAIGEDKELDDSHAGIYDLSYEDDLVAALIASELIEEIHP